MATGPQHFAEAVKRSQAADVYVAEEMFDVAQHHREQAQIHATLALVAATLDAAYYLTGDRPKVDDAWKAALA